MKSVRLFAVGFGVVAGALLAFGLPASPASAHADLLRTTPAIGSVVASIPNAVTLTFSEDVQPVVGQIQVIAPDGSPAFGAQVSPRTTSTIRIPLRQGGPNGTYAVSYRIISDDGHPEIGVVTFSVGAPSATPPVPVTIGGPVVNVDMALAMGTATLLAVAGLVLLVGPVLFLLRLWPAGVSQHGAGQLVCAGLALVAVATLAEVYLQAPYGIGSGSFVVGGGAIRQVLASRYGLVHLARLGVLVAVAVPLARVTAGRIGRLGRVLLPLLALAGLATWPLAGHPRTSALPVLTVVADAAHLGAIAVWLGGLVTLLAFVLPRASTAELSRILPVWSRWAQRAVLVLVLGGVAEAVVEVRGLSPLVTTTYGRLILVKVAVLAVVLVVARYSRQVVQRKFRVAATVAEPAVPALVSASTERVAGGAPPASHGGSVGSRLEAVGADIDPVAAGQPTQRRRLRRAVLAETAGIVVVLAVAMALVQVAPAASAQASQGGYLTGPGVVGGLTHMGMLESPTCVLQVRISPAVTGTNHVRVYAYSRAGAPLTVLDWHGTADLPGRVPQPLVIPLTKTGGNQAAGQLVLPSPGRWQLRFTLTIADAPPTSITGILTVRST